MFTGDILVDDVLAPWFCGKAELGLGESTRLKAQVYFNRYTGILHFRTQVRGYGLWIADLPDIDWNSNTMDGQVHFVQSDFLGIDDLLFIAGSNIRYSTLSGGENLLLPDEDEVRGAGFIHVQWEPVEFLQLTAGLRLDGSDMTDPSLSPRGVVVFRPWPKQAFRAGYGLAFRKPSIFELLSHIRVDNFNPAFPEIVDKLRDDVGNEDLDNMQVRSLEAGWRGRFLDDQLQVAVDFFYNEYKNTIEFNSRVPLRLGLPDIPNSTIEFSNTPEVHTAYGSEVELTWHPVDDWFFWCNLALRQMNYYGEMNAGRPEPEPKVRFNLGGRFYPETGLFADLAVHYVSAYTMYLPDPASILDLQDHTPLGPNLLMIGRLGYRQKLGDASELEMGMTIRTSLMAPFREFPGMPMPSNLRLDTAADFGGELLHRQVAFYLRGSF
jgi:outer membrane receptor protein involved in Fe transport